MYRKIGPNSVVSTDGYTVEATERTCLWYSEDDRRMRVEVERGIGLAVYSQTIAAWEPPHDDDPVRSEDKARILARILDALQYMGMNPVSA